MNRYAEKDCWESFYCKEIKLISPKGNKHWIFIGRTDAEAEAPILWPLDAKSWLIRKDPDAGKDWRQEEKGITGWYGWMAAPTQWTWVWASARRQWRTGKPGMLQSMGSQRVRQDWATEQQIILLFNSNSHLHSHEMCIYHNTLMLLDTMTWMYKRKRKLLIEASFSPSCLLYLVQRNLIIQIHWILYCNI